MSSTLLVLVSLLAASGASTPSTPAGTATVPLQELLPLYAQRQGQTPPPPPAEAVVVKSLLEGRLTSDALQVKARFEVEVLAGERWTHVRLLQLGTDVFPTELPTLEGATVGALDGQLCLVTRTPGRYGFEVTLAVRASGGPLERRAQLRFGPQVAPVPLRLEADATAFTLLEPLPPSGGEAPQVYPREGVLRVAWKTPTAPTVQRQLARPPLEPRITEAKASWVSTLEGKAAVRVRYALRLDREQELELVLPEAHRLERVLLNAVPLPVDAEGGRLKLKVSPSRLGETEGTLEVVLARELGVFHLSGRLALSLPQVSWPVAELRARAHFPAVFNYRREGGSLEQDEAGAVDGEDARTPLPGKVLHFRQYLVSASMPTLELGYSVDISKSYFR